MLEGYGVLVKRMVCHHFGQNVWNLEVGPWIRVASYIVIAPISQHNTI